MLHQHLLKKPGGTFFNTTIMRNIYERVIGPAQSKKHEFIYSLFLCLAAQVLTSIEEMNLYFEVPSVDGRWAYLSLLGKFSHETVE